MSQKSAAVGLVLTLIAALTVLTIAHGTGPERFNLGYGLLMAVATLIVCTVVTVAVTGFQWWLTHRFSQGGKDGNNDVG